MAEPTLIPEQEQRLESARLTYEKHRHDPPHNLTVSERYQTQLGKAVVNLDQHKDSRAHATDLKVDITIAKNMVREGRRDEDISNAVSTYSPNTCGMSKQHQRDYGELVVQAAKHEIGQGRQRPERSLYQTPEPVMSPKLDPQMVYQLQQHVERGR